MGGAEKEDVERRREGLWVETSKAPRIGMLFVDERATLGVLTFLRDTKAGDFVALGALGGEEWWRRRAQWGRRTQCRWM